MDAGTVYSNLDDTTAWSSRSLSPLLAQGDALRRGAFDGRYVYWGGVEVAASPPNVILVRYDTTAAFSDPSSWVKWEGFAQNQSMDSLSFDGRYLYLGSLGARLTRYDTTAAFGDKHSLSYSAQLPPLAGDWLSGSGALGGRYLYFGSCGYGLATPSCARSTEVVRFDTLGDFEDLAAWSAFDPGTGASPVVFAGQQYLVMSPSMRTDTRMVVLDARQSFGTASSWSSFPMQSIAGDETFAGVGADERFVYFIQHGRLSKTDQHPVVARHEMSRPLDDVNSWQTFDLTNLPALGHFFMEASWDGRFFYFINSGTQTGAYVVRYDTSRDFQAPTSWTYHDAHTQPSGLGGGVVFDGEYLYIAAAGDGPVGLPMVLRFDARRPRQLPTGFSGAFF